MVSNPKQPGLIFPLLLLVALLPSVNATHDPNDFFVTEANFPGVTFKAIHGTSTTDLWAVGSTGAGEAIYKRTGGVWAAQTLSTSNPNGDLLDVWALSGTSAKAARTSTTTSQAQSWDGATWTPDPQNEPLGNVWASGTTYLSAEHSTIAGSNPHIRSNTGSSWATAYTFSAASNSKGSGEVWGTSLSDIWVVFDAVSGSASDFYNCTGGPPDFCVGVQPPVASIPFPTDGVTAIWGSDTDDVWFVGGFGQIAHWDGAAITLVASPTQSELKDVFGTSASNVWAVGSGGTIIHYDGTAWTTEPTTVSETIEGVFCLSSNCWLVTESGKIQILSVKPAVALPTLTGLDFDPDDFDIYVSHAQCTGDKVSFSVANDQGTITDLDVYIIDGETNVVIEQVDDSQMFNLNSKAFHFNRTYPSGPYFLLAVADVMAVLSPDVFSIESFNVPVGSCFTPQDASNIQERFDDVDASIFSLQNDLDFINDTTIETETNLTDVHAHIDSHFVYQNTQANETFQSLSAKLTFQNVLLNTTHAHLDAHFVYTNALFNATSVGLNISLAQLIERIDRNVTHLNMSTSNVGILGMANLPGMTQSDTTLFILLFALFIWCSLKGWWFVGFTAGISALKVSVDVFNPGLPPDLPLIAIIMLMFIGFWLEIAVHNYRRYQVKKAMGQDLDENGNPIPRPF